MKLSEYLVEYRQEHGLSQRQLAKKCGLTNGYINMIEKGINPKTKQPIVLSIASYKKIATGTGKTLHDLLSIIDDSPIRVGSAPTHTLPAKSELRFALYGDVAEDVTDEELEAVIDYARFLREKKGRNI